MEGLTNRQTGTDEMDGKTEKQKNSFSAHGLIVKGHSQCDVERQIQCKLCTRKGIDIQSLLLKDGNEVQLHCLDLEHVGSMLETKSTALPTSTLSYISQSLRDTSKR